MTKIDVVRERLSIDVFPEEHRQIKSFAALHGETIREYVLECVRERLRKESEKKDLSGLAMRLDQDPLFKQVWDNERDAAYDKL